MLREILRPTALADTARSPLTDAPDLPRIEVAVRELLLALGEDPDREGLEETPRRVARAYAELCSGLREDAFEHLARTFDHASDEIVTLRGIEFASLCEHHLLPFLGRAHVAYLPGNGRVVGLSKLARCVEVYARRPQLQERLTAQVADSLMEALDPEGSLVVIEAEHMCMKIRGVRKMEPVMTTLAARGRFREDRALRDDALTLLGFGGRGGSGGGRGSMLSTV